MADGTSYAINVEGRGVGLDATADDINTLAASLVAAEAVVTPFDAALSAAKAQLTAAGDAAQLAASELSEAESAFAALQREATRAGKAVERAAAKGKDTTALQAQADAAAAAVREQASAVEVARAAADKAAAAERKLAESFKVVQGAANKSAVGIKNAGVASGGAKRSFGDLTSSATAMGGRFGGLIGMITGVVEGIGRGGKGAGLILAVVAAAAVVFALVAATVALGVAVVATTAKLIGMAIASREAYSKEFTKQSELMKKNISGLFLGVRADKLLGPMKLMAKFFDRNTASGRALATILDTLLNPVIDALVKGAPMMIEFFKGGVIAALDFIIILLRVRNAVVAMIPKKVRTAIRGFIDDIDALAVAGRAGELFFKAFGLAILIALVPLLLIGAVIAATIITFVLLAIAVGKAIEMIGEFFETITDPAEVDRFIDSVVEAFWNFGPWVMEALNSAGDAIYDFFANLTDPAEVDRQLKAMVMSIAAMVGSLANALGPAAKKAGDAFIEGLLQPIRAGKALIRAAAEALGLAAAEGVSASLQIKSPSQVMRKKGQQASKGAELGIEDGTDDVQNAMQRMMAPPPAKGEARSRTAPRGRAEQGRSGNTYHVSIYAPTGDGEDIARAFEAWLIRTAEATAAQLGGGEIPEASGA